MGFGHAFLIVPDQQEAYDFYVNTLGFRESDTIAIMPGLVGQFLHCNPRHHTIVFASVPGMNINGVQHLMVEVDSLDSVGRAYDVVDAGVAPASTSIGMHTNDHMISFYMQTPSGFDIEFGTAGRLIDDSVWSVGHYDAARLLGPQAVARDARPVEGAESDYHSTDARACPGRSGRGHAGHVPGGHRPSHRRHRAPDDRWRAGRHRESVVGRHRIPADRNGGDAGLRQARRPLWPPSDVPDRHRHVRLRLCPVARRRRRCGPWSPTAVCRASAPAGS